MRNLQRLEIIMNHIYFRNLVEDLWKKKVFVLIFLVLTTAVFAFLGFKSSKTPVSLSEEEKQELADYKERLAAYDSQMEELEKNLADQKAQIEDFQKYVEESIYMKLDPQNFGTATAAFTVTGTDQAGYILPALTDYVNNGGLSDDLSALAGDAYSQYWKEMTGCGVNGLVFSIWYSDCTVADAEKVMDYMCTAIENKKAGLMETYGAFELQAERSSYPNQDAGRATGQYNNQTTLTSYHNTYADLENRLLSLKESKKTYIEDKTPDVAEQKNVVLTILIYVIVGALAGLLLSCLFFLFRYILGDKIRSSRDLTDYGMLHFTGVDDISFLAARKGISEIGFLSLSVKDAAQKLAADYIEKLEGNVAVSDFSYEKDCCVLILEAGCSTYHELDETLAKLEKCEVNLLGYIISE